MGRSASWSVRIIERLPASAAALAVAVGLAALLGWQWDIAPLRSVLPGLVAMNPVTALCFILSATALTLLRYVESDRVWRATGYALAAIVTSIALAKLGDVLFGTRLGLDQLLFRARLAAASGMPPNRMAPNTAMVFALLGASLLTLRLRGPAGIRPSQIAALATAGVSLLAVLGYVFEVRQLYGMPSFIPMALNTALTSHVLAVAILFAYPREGLTRVVVSDDAGGAMARRILPVLLLVPAVLAWARSQGQRAGLLDAEPSVSFMVFWCVVLLTAFTWFTAWRLGRADRERLAAVEDLRQSNDRLERRVRERTAELEDANQRLQRKVEEQVQAEGALRDSEQRYRMLFLGNPHPMWVFDRQTLRFLAVNQAAVEVYGYSVEEFLRMTIRDIRPPEDLPELLDELSKPRSDLELPREWRHVLRGGKVLNVEVSSHTLTFAGRDAALVLAVDVTGRRRLETQLLQSQKMEAIGLLAGGVAHDFNNLLTVIVGYAHLLRTGLRDGDPMADDAEEILRAADRAGSLTRQLVAFSRQQVLEPKVVDLNATMAEMDRLLRRVIGEDVDLVFVPGPELGHVKVDPGQIEQVIMNLAVNARDAMPRGGRLTIETAEVTLDAAYAFGRDGLKPGRYVMLAISDTGTGMSPKVAARVFEPFFTTKEQGKGTGLGLSTVHGIVKQSGGHVEVYSEPAHGTTFKVYLPRIGEVAEPLAAPEPAPSPLGSEGGGTVLLVEDEATIRGVVRRTLQARGYRVIEAAHGGDAVEICEEGEQAIDLLVTDVVMPVMSGPELVQRALSARPDLRVLFISGYTDRALVHQGRRSAGTEFLQKPFTPEELVNKVRHVLATPRRRAA